MDTNGGALATALVALLLPCVAVGFFPNGLGSCDGHDASHESMTAAALASVAAALGFTDEAQLRGMPSYADALKTIVAANEAVGRADWWQAAMHFNAEQLTEANEYLADTRDLVVLLVTNASMPDYVLVRRLVGRCLHLAQDFYSNTNWIEQYSEPGTDLYSNLGERGTTIPVDNSPCLSDPSGTNLNNILYSKRPFKLTSGFRSGQDKVKPEPNGVGPQGERKGKCSHGGAEDSSAVLEPMGGINKESFDEWLSPHSFYHGEASKMATLATVKFFIDPERGLLRRIGKDKLSKILGLQPSTVVTLLMNSSSNWLGSDSSRHTDDRREALGGLAAALFGSTYGVSLHGVRLSCGSSQQLFDSASRLHAALLTGEPNELRSSSHGSVMNRCLVGQPEYSAVAVVFDTEIWPTQQTDVDWWTALALKRSIKIFLFMKHGITITNPEAAKQLKDMCSNTGGGLYEFADIEDLTKQLALLPFRISAAARELHPLPRVVMLSPNHTVVAEADCAIRPYASVQNANWSSAAVTTKELSSPSAVRLEELRFSYDNVDIQLHLQSSSCSARLLQTMPYITLELYEKGPYNQVFASWPAANGNGVKAVISITSTASASPATYTIRVRNGNNPVDTSRQSKEYKVAQCGNAYKARGTSYTADISLDAAVSIISVVDNSGFELLSLPYTAPRVKLSGPAHVTDTSQLTVTNVGQAAATAVLRLVSEDENTETFALSESQLRLEPNASSTVKLVLSTPHLADCAQWWLATPLSNCTCSLETRAVIVHLIATDEAGNTGADILPVTVIRCATSASRVATSTTAAATQAVTTARDTQAGSQLTSTSGPATTASPPPPTDLITTGFARPVSTSALLVEAEWSSTSATTTATSRRPEQTAASTAASPVAESAGTAVPTAAASFMPPHVASDASSAASLRLLGITLACTVGFALLFVPILGGILYMRHVLCTNRFDQTKRTKAIYKDEGRWLREADEL